MKLKTAILLSLSLVFSSAQEREARISGACSSLCLWPITSKALPAGLEFTTYFTTFNGRTDRLPGYESIAGSILTGGELRPRIGEPKTYEADYFVLSPELEEWGSVVIQITNQTTVNPVAYDLQRQGPGTFFDYTGTLIADWPKPLESALTGRLDLQNLRAGRHLIQTRFTENASGVFSLTYFEGKVAYGIEPKTFRLDVLWMDPNSQPHTLTATATHSSPAEDQLALEPATFRGHAKGTLRTRSASLVRSGNYYRGILEFEDGNLDTSLPDFRFWHVEITDPNDADRDGLPDLTDPTPENAVTAIRLAVTGGERLPLSITAQIDGQFAARLPYTLWQSKDRITWEKFTSSMGITSNIVRFDLLPIPPARFYRLSSP